MSDWSVCVSNMPSGKQSSLNKPVWITEDWIWFRYWNNNCDSWACEVRNDLRRVPIKGRLLLEIRYHYLIYYSKCIYLVCYEPLNLQLEQYYCFRFGLLISTSLHRLNFPPSVFSHCFLISFCRQAKIESIPIESTEDCAKAIVDSACRGDRYLVEPSWVGILFLFKLLCPEVLEWCLHWLLSSAPRNLKKAA